MERYKIDRLKSVHHGKAPRLADARLNRLQSGNTLLKTHHLRQSIDRRAGLEVSTQCDCGTAPQDTEHYLLECPLFADERKAMSDHIMDKVFSRKSCQINNLNVNLLLGDADETPKDVKVEVRKAILNFLKSTSQDISI